MMLFGRWCQSFVSLLALMFYRVSRLVEVAGIPNLQRRDFLEIDGISRTYISVLLHHCNTRYEWLVRPCSVGTFTL